MDASAVPEPSTWAMMISGFAFLGFFLGHEGFAQGSARNDLSATGGGLRLRPPFFKGNAMFEFEPVKHPWRELFTFACACSIVIWGITTLINWRHS